ncbi:MAG: hypothetical protein O3A47_10585 [Chloroflexi bacterium]|nr:hypothetical protein [Chloroflexota bacterium]
MVLHLHHDPWLQVGEQLRLVGSIGKGTRLGVQVKLIKTGGRLVRHARRLVFQLATVAVPRDLFAAILQRISELRLVPG